MQVSEVLRDILSESAEDLFWRYTNIKKEQDSVTKRHVNALKNQRHFSTHEYHRQSKDLPPSLPTSQENTLKDSLGQSNSQQMTNYFQTHGNTIPQSQVTTFENYRKVQRSSVTPVVETSQPVVDDRATAAKNRRPQTSMDGQRSFGSMKTLGRAHGSSDHASSNVIINNCLLEQSSAAVLPMATVTS